VTAKAAKAGGTEKRPTQPEDDEEHQPTNEATSISRSQDPLHQQQQQQQQPHPKRVKKEPAPVSEAPTPARAQQQQQQRAQEQRPPSQPQVSEPPAKRARQVTDPNAPEGALEASQQRRFAQISGSSVSNSASAASASILNAVGYIKNQLEVFRDMEDIPEACALPECILVGSIAAKRELVAALLGEHQFAAQIAALLVSPDSRQPIALQLRYAPGELDAVTAEQWQRSLSQAVAAGRGTKLKSEPLFLRLNLPGCANIDVIDLPERTTTGGALHPRTDMLRTKYLGASCNMLVCLEPTSLDICRRFDSRMQRTVVLGAAAARGPSGETLPPSTLCGTAAARGLEERFVGMCTERLSQRMSGFASLLDRFSKVHSDASRSSEEESVAFLLRRARDVGISFGRAFQHVISGAPGVDAGALTLEEELAEFAMAAARFDCGVGESLPPEGAAAAAAEVWASFGSVQAYTKFLRDDVQIPGADLPLNGGAAWQRLLLEIEVAMRLATPTKEELAGLHLASVQAGGTGVRGHQLWEDVFEKLVREIAFEPLRRRVRYVAARIGWSLRQQKIAVADWMATLEDGLSGQPNVYARQFSPLFPQHLKVLRSSHLTRELVLTAHDTASDKVASQLLRNVEGTLTAGCINPNMMMRPGTQPDFKPPVPKPAQEEAASGGNNKLGSSGRSGGKAGETKQRVKLEMSRRSGKSGGLPLCLQQRVYHSKEALVALPTVEMQLRSVFSRLTRVLAHQVYAFADTALNSLCRVHLDEAINRIAFSPEQERAVSKRYEEHLMQAKQAEVRLTAARNCIEALKGVTSSGASIEVGRRGLFPERSLSGV